MPRTITLHPLSLLVGLGLALVGVVAMGQMQVSSSPVGNLPAIAPGYGIGNSDPRDMIQFTSASSWNNYCVTLAPSAQHGRIGR